MLAEGRIKWAFCPPDTNIRAIVSEDKGHGIWIQGDFSDDAVEDTFSYHDGESDRSLTDSEEDDVPTSESSAGSVSGPETGINTSTGMFSALTLEDSDTPDGNS